jgi:hypothetical protein
MGVYFFACDAAYFKVGHHCVTAARPNVYYRVARRGFQSCVHPACLDRRLAMDDVRLLAWFPTLGGRDEGALHRMDPDRIGEFHRTERLVALLDEARRRGADATVTEAEKEQARVWARGRGRRATAPRAPRRKAVGRP